MQSHYDNIISLLRFLSELVHRRLLESFTKEAHQPFTYPELQLESNNSAVYELVVQYQLIIEEIAILLIALAPHLQPNFFDYIIQEYMPQGGDFLEIGGIKGSNHRGMLPTGETAQFILAGRDLNKRIEIQQLLLGNSTLIRQNIISLETVKEGEPIMSG